MARLPETEIVVTVFRDTFTNEVSVYKGSKEETMERVIKEIADESGEPIETIRADLAKDYQVQEAILL